MNYNNLAERSNFIAGSSQFKHIPFFITSVNIPDITIDHPEVSGGRFSHNLKLPGDTIRYGILSFEMLVDEDLLIYEELYNLLEANTNAENNTFGDFSFDFFIEVNNNKGNSVMVFDFENCRINNIGSLNLETTDDLTNYRMTIEVFFDKFKLRRVKQYNLTGEYDIIRKRAEDLTSEFINSFNLDDFVVWGLPLPRIVNNTNMEDVISMVHPKESEFESGIIKIDGFDPLKPIEIRAEFEVLDLGGSVRFGLTEGSGINSNINGRTGRSLTEYSPESSGIYTIQWNPNGSNVDIVILNDLIEIGRYNIEQTSHSEIFLYFQGKEGSFITSIEYRI